MAEIVLILKSKQAFLVILPIRNKPYTTENEITTGSC